MDPQLQKSINIKSLPNNPNLVNTQANQQLLEELNTDNNLTNEILSEIKKQEKSLQQDVAYNRLIEERQNDIMKPDNPFTNPHKNNTNNTDIPANIITQMPSINIKQIQQNDNNSDNNNIIEEEYTNIVKENTKKNKRIVPYDDDDDDDLIIDDNQESYYMKFINYIKGLYKEFIYTCIFFFIFNLIEVDLIASASLSSLIKIDLIKYTKYIGAIVFTILYLICKKYIL
jgi:hypothetical protein